MHVMRWISAFILLIVSVAQAQPGDNIMIGSGPRDGHYYAIGGAVCRVLNSDHPSSCSVAPTGGSVDNLYALSLGDVNFAIVQADVHDTARSGLAKIPGSYSELRTVASVYSEMLTVVIRADSDIFRFSDLIGRKVAAGTFDSGSYWAFRSMLKSLDLTIADFGSVAMQTDTASALALCNHDLDAFLMMTGHPSNVLSRIGDTCPVRVVALSIDEVRAMLAHNPSYRPIAVPPGLYSFAPHPVPTVGVDTMLVTFEKTPDWQVEAILSSIFGDVEAFRQQQYGLSPRPASTRDPFTSYHPAAIRYFSRRGMTQ